MKSITRIWRGVVVSVVSAALLLGCLPITAKPALAAPVSEQVMWSRNAISRIFLYQSASKYEDTANGITVTDNDSRGAHWSGNNIQVTGGGGYEFSVSDAQFTKIVINFGELDEKRGSFPGWTLDTNTLTWTGSSATVNLDNTTRETIKSVSSIVFTIEYEPGTITASATGYEGTYDGQSHGITVNVSEPASGYTIMYGTSEGDYNIPYSPGYIGVGTYTVFYKVTAPRCTPVTGSETVVINEPAGTRVTWDSSVVNSIDLDNYGDSFSDNVNHIDLIQDGGGEWMGSCVCMDQASFMFNCSEGHFTSIVIAYDDSEDAPGTLGEGWVRLGKSFVWSGSSDTCSFVDGSAYIWGVYSITFYIESDPAGTIEATATGFDGVYDGEEHGISVNVTEPAEGATVLYGTEEGVYTLDESPAYSDIGTYTVYYQVSAEGYEPLEGSATVAIREDGDDPAAARENLMILVEFADAFRDEWGDQLPDDIYEDILDAEVAALTVLDNESATAEQLNAAADNLTYALAKGIEYIMDHNDGEPELTPEQRTRLCVINFVENLYIHTLGRPFDVSGRDTWVSLIMDQGGTGTDVARGFLGSAEFGGLNLDDEGFVRALYSALFNRTPSDAEVNTWTTALASGVTRAEVIDSFFASPEWASTCAYYRVNI